MFPGPGSGGNWLNRQNQLWPSSAVYCFFHSNAKGFGKFLLAEHNDQLAACSIDYPNKPLCFSHGLEKLWMRLNCVRCMLLWRHTCGQPRFRIRQVLYSVKINRGCDGWLIANQKRCRFVSCRSRSGNKCRSVAKNNDRGKSFKLRCKSFGGSWGGKGQMIVRPTQKKSDGATSSLFFAGTAYSAADSMQSLSVRKICSSLPHHPSPPPASYCAARWSIRLMRTLCVFRDLS